jgi:endonuclease/exonuclease/phosphatase family metal-dependent hydrolase
MKRVLAALLVVSLGGCAMRGGAEPLTIVSYNIHAGKDDAGQLALERVAAVLDTLRADIVLLQEVDRKTRRSEGVDHLAELERLTGMKGAFGKSLDFQGGEYGIAVLSRFPILESHTVPLKVEPPQERSEGSHEPRVALHVAIDAPGGRLHIVNTHVDYIAAGTYRRQEIVGLLAYVARTIPRDARLVIGGDLNARPDTDEITTVSLMFHDSFAECGQGAGESYPAKAPDRRIDYLFFRNGRCRDARVWPTLASDHRPLRASLELW